MIEVMYEELNEYAYYAEISGLQYDVFQTSGGLHVR